MNRSANTSPCHSSTHRGRLTPIGLMLKCRIQGGTRCPGAPPPSPFRRLWTAAVVPCHTVPIYGGGGNAPSTHTKHMHCLHVCLCGSETAGWAGSQLGTSGRDELIGRPRPQEPVMLPSPIGACHVTESVHWRSVWDSLDFRFDHLHRVSPVVIWTCNWVLEGAEC